MTGNICMYSQTLSVQCQWMLTEEAEGFGNIYQTVYACDLIVLKIVARMMKAQNSIIDILLAVTQL